MSVPKPKKFTAEIDYDTSVECAACGAAIHPNMLVFVSKDKVRCPRCNAIFTPNPGDIRWAVYSRALANARPDPDFRYFSKAIARASSVNAI